MKGNDSVQVIKRQFGIVGESSSLNRAVELAMLVAQTDLSVLIVGENGSGKEVFSKIIHALSNRKSKNFIAINCGAIPEGTIDSELFGHKKGAFTGALEDRKGYFEEADKGTLFLDEIGDLPLASQARLLRALEDGEIIRVGTSISKKVDTRIVAATNVDLYKAISMGKFREDLFYRLNSLTINVPPLRERKKDIILLFCKFVSDFVEKYHAKPISLSAEAEELLLNYSFPGNVRQLRNIVKQISLLEEDSIIKKEILSNYLPKQNLVKISESLIHNNEEEVNTDFLYKSIVRMHGEINSLKSVLTHLLSSLNKKMDLSKMDFLNVKGKDVVGLLTCNEFIGHQQNLDSTHGLDIQNVINHKVVSEVIHKDKKCKKTVDESSANEKLLSSKH